MLCYNYIIGLPSKRNADVDIFGHTATQMTESSQTHSIPMRNVYETVIAVCFQVLKKIAKYVQEQNDKIYAPRGLLLTDPIERGLRVVSTLVSDVVEKNCLLSSVR